jgi:hypothetical protein
LGELPTKTVLQHREQREVIAIARSLEPLAFVAPLLLYVGDRLFALGVSRQIEPTNDKHFFASISPTRAREALRFALAVAMAIASYPHPIKLQLRVSHWYPRNPERKGF